MVVVFYLGVSLALIYLEFRNFSFCAETPLKFIALMVNITNEHVIIDGWNLIFFK